MILAQLGARIIKVEMPGKGDDSRAFGPFVNAKSLYFASLNHDRVGSGPPRRVRR